MVHEELRQLLEGENVGFEVIHHVPDVQALKAAEDTRTPAQEFAKVVVVHVDDHYALAVLPATHYLAPSRLARSIGAARVWLASESEMRRRAARLRAGNGAALRRALWSARLREPAARLREAHHVQRR